ncbi:hypothetical protein CB0940_07119 [Cercospora beticola]|uniref:Uncharacterized protein n=1 Tax=Cercospora beticola TaxID=122368 RepID=A0A2G5HB53_CERBT|nr:hypothetical protein CB0940_07119 [Cercospora beticola]PIA89482.1 hypothetical protein CB0940_07119 [Cercospora beticola]
MKCGNEARVRYRASSSTRIGFCAHYRWIRSAGQAKSARPVTTFLCVWEHSAIRLRGWQTGRSACSQRQSHTATSATTRAEPRYEKIFDNQRGGSQAFAQTPASTLRHGDIERATTPPCDQLCSGPLGLRFSQHKLCQ